MLVWDKMSPTGRGIYMKDSEFTLYLWKEGQSTFNERRASKRVWRPSPCLTSVHKRKKPVDLMRLYIDKFTLLQINLGAGIRSWGSGHHVFRRRFIRSARESILRNHHSILRTSCARVCAQRSDTIISKRADIRNVLETA